MVGALDLLSGLLGRGDTVVGNDVCFGYRAIILPGVRIDHGAIIASGAVVVDDHGPGIVGGDPARLVPRRYSEDSPAGGGVVALAGRPSHRAHRRSEAVAP